MKKILLLILVNLMVMSGLCYAGTVTVTPYISGNDVQISTLNDNQNAIVNTINGSIEGGVNIKAGSLVSQDFSDSVSIVTYRDEAFNDFTVTGGLPATSANLTSDISYGVHYVSGQRIVKEAAAHTYTASKDTYVYMASGGYYIFEEVANGAAAPSTPANSLLLAKVVTDADNITSVTDSRTTSVQITQNSSSFPINYRDGAFVSRDTTTTFHVEPGQIAIGNTAYVNTADTSTKSISTETNWIEGVKPFSEGTMFIYAYNSSGSAFDFKFCSADPVYSDTSENTGGVKKYYTTGGVWYRAIGWAYMSADAVQVYAYSNTPDTGIKNKIRFEFVDFAIGATSIPWDDTIPQISEGHKFIENKFRSFGNTSKLKISGVFCSCASGVSFQTISGFIDSQANAIGSQSFYHTGGDYPSPIPFNFETSSNASTATLQIRSGNDDGDSVKVNGVATARKLGGNMKTVVEIEEVE